MLARHFPLHLYPNDTRAEYGIRLKLLPYGISLQQIYLDFLRYLLRHTKAFFEGHILDGERIWSQLKPTMEVLIACPREWGPREQQFLRNVVVNAGFVDNTGQILFMAESEAIAYFLCHQANIVNHFEVSSPTKHIVICNAGQSATKITTLCIIATQPVFKFKELHSTYIQAGGALVDAAVEKYLKGVLRDAGLGDEDISDYTTQGVRYFSDHVKMSFHDATARCTIEITKSRFNNPSIKARRGRMELPGAIVQFFFNSCVGKISKAIDSLIQALPISDILLTGEFGGSSFLQKTLQERYRPKGYRVSPLDNFYSSYNIIADGAVIWGASNNGISPVPRYSYGFIVSARFDPQINEHRGRETYTASAGYEKVVGAWSQIIDKGAEVDCDKVIRVPFNRNFTSSRIYLIPFKTDLFLYWGAGKPNFARDQQGNLLSGFQNVCTLTADLSSLHGALEKVDAPGQSYWTLAYDLCLHFGGTEVSASIEWQEKGITCMRHVEVQPAEFVYAN
ncbi:hypothetical protein BDV93DRAFT_189709 [Ceratobasidium sp. AG-I]|nr:hypothetical protein BDV93DRAFT_189709 [Ceratobasidium sp. AG-I]